MEDFLFFDWYAASIPDNPRSVGESFLSQFPHCVWEITKPRNGYTHGDNLVNQFGEVVLTLFYGGGSQGNNVFAFSSGDKTSQFVSVLRSLYPVHEVVRVDVALDYDEVGVWESLYSHGVAVSRATSISNRYIGAAGSESALETIVGRSLYIGSRSSVSMIRVYEKGKKDDKTRPNWVRAEYEFKPKNNRGSFAAMSPLQILNSTKLGRHFFSVLVNMVKTKPIKSGTIRTKSSHEQSLEHLKKQYRNVLRAELQRCGGSFEQLGLSLLADSA